MVIWVSATTGEASLGSPLPARSSTRSSRQDWLNKWTSKYIRAGTGKPFRPGCSCSDHIFTLRQILEPSKEWNAPLYPNFIDFEKAFDGIHRDTLGKILRHYGIPPKLVTVIKMLYLEFKSQVICNAALTDALSVTTGVKQRCILTPFLGFETSD